ncbi:MAG: aminopeptidase P family protein [Acidimicrobiales bacterium]|nr:aminopeptidase P family protein [Acidimicrobiales bacterium]
MCCARPWTPCCDDAGLRAVTNRVARLRSGFGDAGIDALLVTDPNNIRYLSGFTGSSGWLFVGADDAATVLLTDGRYSNQAPAEIAGHQATIDVDPAFRQRDERLAQLAAAHPRIGLEAASITWADQQRVAAALGSSGAEAEAEVVATSGLVEALREVKDANELAAIERAVACADHALAETMGLLAPGRTEREVAHALDAAMRAHGATGPGYETIVAAGPNAALPHARPTDRALAEGDLVVIDVGALVDGYRSDMTRTFVIGSATPTQERMLDVVTEAQAAGVARVAPGVPTAEVDAACRSVIADAGWGDAFSHGTGHGVGLAIHEAPAVGERAAATLQPGHVITVEPGVYLPEHGGVRVEDLVLVTDDGHRVLTNSPKQPYAPYGHYS